MSWERPKGAHHLCRAQHTSGMEKNHQEWVTDTLNFLQEMGVRTYEGGWNANSLEGMELPKGEVMPITRRLKIFRETILTERAKAARTQEKLFETEKLRRTSNELLMSAEDMLELIWLAQEDGDELKFGVVLAKLGTLLEKRRPHLFEKEETDDDGTR